MAKYSLIGAFLEINKELYEESLQEVRQAIRNCKIFMLADKWRLTEDDDGFEEELYDKIVEDIRRQLL